MQNILGAGLGLLNGQADIGDIAKIGMELAGTFLDKPDDIRPPEHLRPTTAGSFCHGSGNNNTTSLTLVPGTTRPKANDPFEPITMMSQMAREAYVRDITVPSTAAENDELDNFPVDVTSGYEPASGAGSTRIQHTPLTYYASLFTYWRGSITYRFQYVGNKFDQGKLWICWTPLNQKASNLPDGATGNMGWYHGKVWNIHGPGFTELDIPYMSQNPWCLVNSYGAEFAPSNTEVIEYGNYARYPSRNGVIHLVWLTKPVTGAPTSRQPRILVTHRAGPDFEVAVPNGNHLYARGQTALTSNILAKNSSAWQAVGIDTPEPTTVYHHSGRDGEAIHLALEDLSSDVYGDVARGRLHALTSSLQETQDITTQTGKEFIVYQGDWTSTGISDTVVPLLKVTGPDHPVSSLAYIASQYRLASFDLSLKAVINGTPFHSGLLAIQYIPHLGWTGNGATQIDNFNPLNTFGMVATAYLNPTASNTGSLRIPMVMPYNKLSGDMMEKGWFGNLRVWQIVPLGVADGGSPSLTVTIWAKVENLKLDGYTNPAYSGIVASPLLGLRNHAGADDGEGPQRDGEDAAAVEDIPQINADARPTPDGQEQDIDYSTLTASLTTFGESHMDMYQLVQADQIIGRYSFTQPKKDRSSKMFQIPVTPRLNFYAYGSDGIAEEQTRLATFSRGAAAWSGSLRFKFGVRCSNLSGIVMRAWAEPITGQSYSPSGNLQNTPSNLQWKAGNFNIDTFLSARFGDRGAADSVVNGFGFACEYAHIQPVLDVRVPFLAPTAYCPLPIQETTGDYELYEGTTSDNYALYHAQSCSALLNVFLDSTPMEDDMDIDIDVYVAAGDDFRLLYPNVFPTSTIKYLD